MVMHLIMITFLPKTSDIFTADESNLLLTKYKNKKIAYLEKDNNLKMFIEIF